MPTARVFPARRIKAVDINFTDAEHEAYDLLQHYAATRHSKASTAAPRVGDLVMLILRKRLFSSPTAFALTLESRPASEDQDHHPERTGYVGRYSQSLRQGRHFSNFSLSEKFIKEVEKLARCRCSGFP
jgi:hypothetical protein